MHPRLCDREIKKTLKLIIIGELNMATLHTGINLSIAWHIKGKSASTSSAASNPVYQY